MAAALIAFNSLFFFGARFMKMSDLSTPAFFVDPYPVYDEMRKTGFVRFAPNLVATGRYAYVETLLQDRRLGKSYLDSVIARYGREATAQPVFRSFASMFLMANPPAHTRARALLNKAFNARHVELMREICQSTADRLVAQLVAKRTFDLVADYAQPLPVEIISRLLDIPVNKGIELGGAASLMANALNSAPINAEGVAEASAATCLLEEYFAGVIAARRENPGEDLISALIAAELDGDGLDENEIIANVILLFVAGHETTSNLISNGLIALHRNPSQLADLRQHPALIHDAVSECLRFDTSVHVIVRSVLEEVQLDDEVLAPGTNVFLMLGAANRDPARFDAPDLFDIRRKDKGKLIAFGAGIHYCLGARLAVLEIEIALQTLLQQLPDLKLQNLDALTWRPRNNLRGVASLLATAD